ARYGCAGVRRAGMSGKSRHLFLGCEYHALQRTTLRRSPAPAADEGRKSQRIGHYMLRGVSDFSLPANGSAMLRLEMHLQRCAQPLIALLLCACGARTGPA